MGLVADWLNGIGLDYATSSFTAAGIVTPVALGALDVNHFEALGVREGEDRRKLFILVQRIKVAINKTDNSVSAVDAVLAKTMGASKTIDADTANEVDTQMSPRKPNVAKENKKVTNGVGPHKRISPRTLMRSQMVMPSIDFPPPKDDEEASDKRRESEESSANTDSSPEKIDLEVEDSSKITTRRMSKRLIEKRFSQDTERLSAEGLSTKRISPRGISNESSASRSTLLNRRSSVESFDQHSDDGDSSTVSSGRRSSGVPMPKGRLKEPSGRVQNPSKSLRTGKSLSTIPADSIAPMSPLIALPPSKLDNGGGKGGRPRPPDLLRKSSSLKSVREGESDSDSRSVQSLSKEGSRRKSKSRVSLTGLRRMSSYEMKTSDSFDSTSVVSEPSSSRRSRKSLSGLYRLRSDDTSPESSSHGARDDDSVRSFSSKHSSFDDSSSVISEPSWTSRQPLSSNRLSRSSSQELEIKLPGRGNNGVRKRQATKLSPKGLPKSPKGPSNSSSQVSVSQQSLPSTERSRTKGPDSATQARTGDTSKSQITIQGRKEDDSFKAQIAKLQEENEADHELFGVTGDNNTFPEDMRIRVVVRKRPMSRAEIAAAGDVDVIHPLDYKTHGRVLVYQPKTRVDLTKEIETLPFAFDNVFDQHSTNEQIYERSVRNVIPALFEGRWASIFAYGQTGSGKTFTMMGSNLTGINSGTSRMEMSNLGLYYMAALDVFEVIKTPGYENFEVSASLFEIYSGKLYDLINNRKVVKCLEDSRGKVCFPGLSEHSVENPTALIDMLELGAANRSTGTTSRNADSSRSHAVLQLHLRKKQHTGRSPEHSRLTFIDLAGSERGADTSSSSRATRMEGAEINTSLLALKEVIRALATGGSLTHVPFRGSKLTQVLKESFVGKNCQSVMIACISPNIGNCDQTLNTLRYADRVKERNPETGEMTITEPATSRRTSSVVDVQHVSVSSINKRETSISPPQVRTPSMSSNHSFDSTSAMLDDLLSSPAHGESPRKEPKGRSKKEPRVIAEDLILAHKEMMPVLLGMVKEEMALVHKAGADRDGLDDYITRIHEIQENQVAIIAQLREHILNYRIAGAGKSSMDEDDVSFEDLRE